MGWLKRLFSKLFGSKDSYEPDDYEDYEENEEYEEPEVLSEEIEDFLNQADEMYIRAYETRTLSYLKDFFTRECIVKLSSQIANTSGRYFSSAKFRTTEWSLLSKDYLENGDETWTVLKDVIFHQIRVAGGMKMKVSQDYSETWVVLLTDEEILVSKVKLN